VIKNKEGTHHCGKNHFDVAFYLIFRADFLACMFYLLASSTATVAPTMELLPIPVGQEITANQWLF